MAVPFTEEQLKNLDKSFLVQMYMNLQEQMVKQTQEMEAMNEKMQRIMEQLVLANNNRFGRSSEKMELSGQISFLEVDGEIVFFNEAEAVCELEEADEADVKPARRRKAAGKKTDDIGDLPVREITHYLSEEELTKEFGAKGWKTLPDAVFRYYHFIPARVEVEEHHVGVYASRKEDRIIKAPHPRSLLHGSLVSPSLAAAIINGKYVNAVPLYRQEQELIRYGLNIPRRNMANWMIQLADRYLGILYDCLHKKLYGYHVIQADETPCLVNKDGRAAGSKSYMWVYRSGHMYPDKQIVLYDYQKTRNASHPREFLKGFSGICVTDGYQVYHTLEKEFEELTIAGCWVHARRKFDEAQKVLSKQVRKKSVSYLIMKQIQAIYREEGKLKELSSKERLENRQLIIHPLVDALFAYLKKQNQRSSVPEN